ncbi:hypothetical protein ASZ78_004942 [Callipepla squamata]|uniref:Annexin n=1 Tax=Callipepla squamata TaxID=9009 RepID=A0A226MH15_CALSU|nr:hypothetical protein ASZ78_004942 [Callipepla squamata]
MKTAICFIDAFKLILFESYGDASDGCEKDVLIDILTQRCNSQRLLIAEAYGDMYGRDLITDLKENLSHHFKEVMVGLMYPPASYDAHELWHALKGVNTEENCLIDILASRSNTEIFQMKEAYLMQMNRKITSLSPGNENGRIRGSFFSRSGCHDLFSSQVFQEFQNISGQDLVDAINDCYDGYFQELLVAIVLCVRDKPSYFASRLHSAIHDFGFHNKTVIRILIARSEIDLMTIRQRYKERYGKSLFHDIKHFASGHYERALLAICAGDAEDY